MYQILAGLLLLFIIYSFPLTESKCYIIKDASGNRYNVCDPVEFPTNKSFYQNITSNEFWMILPNLPPNQNLTEVNSLLYYWSTNTITINNISAFLYIHLYDQNGTDYSWANYPIFSNRYFRSMNYLNVMPINQPIFLNIYTEQFNISNPGPPIGPVSSRVQFGNSYTYLDQNLSYEDKIPSVSTVYRSWIFPPINDNTKQQIYVQLITDCNDTQLNLKYLSCPMGCEYPYESLPMMNEKYNGKNIFLAFPPTNYLFTSTLDILSIIGISNNGTMECNVKTDTYLLNTMNINLNTFTNQQRALPGRYTIFFIPYNPFNGERLPPEINITVTITPTSVGNYILGLYYNHSMEGANMVTSTIKSIQQNPTDKIEVTFSSIGPFEYVSVYNFGTDIAQFSIQVGNIPYNDTIWWLWIIVGVGVLVFICVGVWFLWRRRGYISLPSHT